jgi:hypothetical protein
MLTGVVKSAFHSGSAGYEPLCLDYVNEGNPQGILCQATSAVLLEPTGLLIFTRTEVHMAATDAQGEPRI